MALFYVLVLLSTAVCVISSSYPTEVIHLTDANFEHDTQASTGQTTGAWAVLFTDSTLKSHEQATLVLKELAEDEDKELIYGQVDVARSTRLARRFGDTLFPPCILLFRSRQMYLFDMSFERQDIVQQIKDFVTSGFALADPLDVPPPRDGQLNVEAFQGSTRTDPKIVGFAVLMIVGGLLFQTWAIVNKDKFRPESGTKEVTVAEAAAKKAKVAASPVPASPTAGGKKAAESKHSSAATASPSGGKAGASKSGKKPKAS